LITLPSGAELKITLSPFEPGRELYQACLEEAQKIELDMEASIDGNFWKNIFCSLLVSKKVEKCIWKCLEKATYNGNRITPDTFEPEEARGDYFDVIFEVAKVNINPFANSLYVKYGHLLGLIKNTPT